MITMLIVSADISKAGYINEYIKDEENTSKMGENSHKLINDYPDLFPTKDILNILDFYDMPINSKELEKSFSKFDGQIIYRNGIIYDAVDVHWNDFKGEKKLVSYFYVTDAEGYNYKLLDLDASHHVKGDKISFYGLPLVKQTYNNNDGGNTRIFVVLSSYIE